MKSDEIKGEWSVDGNDRIFSYKDFKVRFIKMPDETNSAYQDIYEIKVNKEGKQVARLGVRRYIKYGKPDYMLLEITPEKDVLIVRNYGAVSQEQEVIAVHCILFYDEFEKRVLKHIDYDQYIQIRTKAVEFLKKGFKQARYINVPSCTEQFMFLTFEPKQNRYNYYLTATYDYKNERTSILNNKESLREFLEINRIELNNGKNEPLIVEKNKKLLMSLVRYCSFNQFKTIVSNVQDILKSKHVNNVKADIEKRLENYKNKLKEPTIKSNSLTFTLLHTWYPGEIEQWTITEKNEKIDIKIKQVLKQVYVPGFITEDFKSPEADFGYIR